MGEPIRANIHELGDLELALLICLLAREHCIISADPASKHELQDELRIICSSVFGLHPAVVECSHDTTPDEFSESILVDSVDYDGDDTEHKASYDQTYYSTDSPSARGRAPGRFGSNILDNRRIADVIIATNLDLASECVQVQALELIRTKRIFTRTAMHTASKDFMVIATTSKPGARLSKHVNDLFCMSHFHSVEDGLPYLQGEISKDGMPKFSESDIKELRLLAHEAHFMPELAAYLHNIVVFMRSSRYIQGGVTATATRQLRVIAKILAPLHGLDYVPPSLVALAVHKVYPHRLRLATAETERSLQWGSDPEAVRQLLEGLTIEDAIEDVLASVETPL
ncbi:hypothetical protein LTR37_015600 [Vermiconidia calcicola]|uniref:Uncharacterized protein n=1 Tax=Vermiconidia calcicola TaxID=1690605 RepID=A0ACC3MQ82_9PEZI|nr:hypothetical protein LTR37_015600 [Vermiconidia calcicola]